MISAVLELPVAFADARAADLGLHLGLPPQAALAVSTVAGDGWTAELRILGASHQVLIGRGGRTMCSETVACHLPEEGHRLAPLPERHRLGPERSDYEFHSRVAHVAPADFRRTVEELLHDQDEDGRGLRARFPGDELGATALRLDPDASDDWVSWRTWHTYPRTGEVVTTSSRIRVGVGPSPGRA